MLLDNYSFRFFDAIYRFKINLQHCKKDFKKTDIHNFRVAVKEIDALVQSSLLIPDVSNSSFISDFTESLHRIYKPAGKFRTYSIIHQIGKKAGVWNLIIDAEQVIQSSIHQYQTAFDEEIHNYVMPHLGSIRELFDEIEEADLEDSIAKKIIENYQSAQIQLDGNSDFKLWHEARKSLKNNFFLLQLIATEENNYNDEIKLNRKLEKLLGKWHDWKVLENFISNQDVEPEILSKAKDLLMPSIESIEIKIIQQKNKLFKMLSQASIRF